MYSSGSTKKTFSMTQRAIVEVILIRTFRFFSFFYIFNIKTLKLKIINSLNFLYKYILFIVTTKYQKFNVV